MQDREHQILEVMREMVANGATRASVGAAIAVIQSGGHVQEAAAMLRMKDEALAELPLFDAEFARDILLARVRLETELGLPPFLNVRSSHG